MTSRGRLAVLSLQGPQGIDEGAMPHLEIDEFPENIAMIGIALEVLVDQCLDAIPLEVPALKEALIVQ